MTPHTMAAAIPMPVPIARATAHLATPICTCGQDLDVYTSRHCPRCGINLHHAHLLTPAA